MVVELGHFATIAALVLALALGLLGQWSATHGAWRNAVTALASAQFACLCLGFAALLHAFVGNDFSVAYVAGNSSRALPWHFRLSAAWGGHEGSFLLWTLVLAGWTWAASLGTRRLPDDVRGRLLGVLGLLNFGFLLFLLATSSPFERLVGVPADGADLNPLLQDRGLLVHPPILYLGYVGFAVPFAFAVAGLQSRRLDAAWARWTRRWANVAWALLTVGIALGSWWAYYELGWGGWWFWDPVENASFMPWLAGTALVHSLAVAEKRGAFKSWTVFLAIAAFSLSLFGLFIVRSGVITSVHAFASDPERGLFILWLLVLAIGGALALYGFRAPTARGRARHHGASRELMLLANNLLLVLALAAVLIGTLYPLVYETATGEKISVGPPYFNRVFVPLALVLAGFLALAPVARWKHTPPRLFKNAGLLGLAALGLGVVAPLVAAGAFKLGAALAIAFGLWVVASHAVDFRRRRATLTRGYVGMTVAHLGFAVALVGIGVTSEFSREMDVRMAPGDRVELDGVVWHFTALSQVQGPNYVADRGEFLADGERLVAEKRRYASSGQVMTEAGIAAGFWRDRFVALGEPLADGSWGVRINHKPLVRWVWLGAFLAAIGGVLAAFDPRYRRLAAPGHGRLAQTPTAEPSAGGARGGLPPRMEEPSAGGARGGLPPRMEEPSAGGARGGLPPRMKEPRIAQPGIA